MDTPSSRKPKRAVEIRRRRVSKSRGSPYRTSQSSNSQEEMVDGHPAVMAPMAIGGVAMSTAVATTVTNKRGVIENKPDSGSPISDEGELVCVLKFSIKGVD